jgi:hypothetical protein
MYEAKVQDALWDASVEAVLAATPELMVPAEAAVVVALQPRSHHVSPALPCTEVWSASPNCFCFGFLC